MKKGPHFSSKKSTKKWFYQLPLDVMYAKNRKNHFFVFFGIHYVQPQKTLQKTTKNGEPWGASAVNLHTSPAQKRVTALR